VAPRSFVEQTANALIAYRTAKFNQVSTLAELHQLIPAAFARPRCYRALSDRKQLRLALRNRNLTVCIWRKSSIQCVNAHKNKSFPVTSAGLAVDCADFLPVMARKQGETAKYLPQARSTTDSRTGPLAAIGSAVFGRSRAKKNRALRAAQLCWSTENKPVTRPPPLLDGPSASAMEITTLLLTASGRILSKRQCSGNSINPRNHAGQSCATYLAI
jgi:hypothetical protein